MRASSCCVDLADDVLEPLQVVLGGLEPQLGLVAAGMQTGDAGGLFEHAPARLRLGRDELADLALAHHGRRAGAGRGVGEQQLHVARAHFAAVDAVGRARVALDAARDLELVVLVEGGGRGAVGVVDVQHDLGGVARRAVAGAGEDDVVHVGGAHRLVRALAHHPAQRFDEVRLAAAVGPDDAGEAGLDQDVRRLDEGLEADHA